MAKEGDLRFRPMYHPRYPESEWDVEVLLVGEFGQHIHIGKVSYHEEDRMFVAYRDNCAVSVGYDILEPAEALRSIHESWISREEEEDRDVKE